MREILFRGKDVRTGYWKEGSLVREWLGVDIGYTIRDVPDRFNQIAFRSIVDPKTVGQFTGLTDKNGKKIFEGDIIKIVPDYDYSDDYSISKVYSYNGILCVDYHGDDFDSTALGFLDDYLPDGDFEVIGNIHDNPELLEADE